MLPAPHTHQFHVNGEPYTLRVPGRAGDRRIQQQYALALSQQGITPTLLHALDGDNLYVEAVATECLVEAPEYWWKTPPAPTPKGASPNGVEKIVSFEHVPLDIWQQFRQEVETFLATFPGVVTTAVGETPSGRPEDADPVARPQNIPAVFRGVAE